MKPDGVAMETTEPTEAAVAEEPSSLQENILDQASSKPEEAGNDVAPGASPKANGKPAAAEPKVKPKGGAAKTQPPTTAKFAGASRSNSRPGTASHRTVNEVKSSNNVSAAKTTVTAKSPAAGAVPKRPMGVAVVSTTVKNQTRVLDRKPVGLARTTSVAAATVTNGTKPTTVNGIVKKRPVAETVRPKTTVTASRPVASTAPKPGTLTTTKAGAVAVSKTTRPTTGPSTSRPASTTSRPATAKPSTSATAKTAATRVTTASSTGRTTAAQPPKTAAAAKKDVSRPPPAAVAKKPTATTSAATKRPEPSKPTANVKLSSASKWSAQAKTADPKGSQAKTQQPAKSTPTKKPVAAVRLPALNKPPLGRTPPASPANKPANSSTSQTKRGTKPTQAVSPFTAAKKTTVTHTTTPAVEAQSAATAAVVAATATTVLAETQTEATLSLPQASIFAASAPEEVLRPVLAQDNETEAVETAQSHTAASSPPRSPARTALPQTSPPQEQLQSSVPLIPTQVQMPASAEPTLPPVASPPDLSEEPVYLLTDQTPSTSKALAAASSIPQIVSSTNLNEEDDEEEREGSQLVSVSEMSGTTQPTEESRPGSAGQVGGSAWRAGGALLSELDSEDVSGSQQGASELSAPGVLEGTESLDDLGDGSLKGAIDMEGASAGSPDFEKVPDIPANDFDEDEDDDDRVCDMDVGSERVDEQQRPRHDNDVDDEEEDEDVEMASEGVTESGLESYGNADEDDFAEDERLDNLNRVAQPPPPPPLLPSAPAAQWDQPNPFADPWAEPLQPQQVLEHVSQSVQGAAANAASPLADPWQADSETPTQTQAQAWLDLGSASLVPENQGGLHHSSVKDDPQSLEAQMFMNPSSPAPMQTLVPAPLSAPGMSLSSTLSSETSTPEELCDFNGDGKLQPQDVQAAVLSPHPDQDYQDLGIHLEGEEEAEAETLPADEVLGGPATAPTSNPSSSSETEEEASDTEGEAQLDDSLERPAVCSLIFNCQPPAQRCLSTVEEGEDEVCAVDDATPPSATSLASYGFDTMTTASNSNAQSTGESCIKSPGIFSLEELPEEAKEPGLIPLPHRQPSLPEQQYIECGKQETESAEHVGEEVPGPEETLDTSSTLSTLQQPEENPDDIQPPYYSAICEKTENSFAGNV